MGGKGAISFFNLQNRWDNCTMKWRSLGHSQPGMELVGPKVLAYHM